MPLLEIVYEGRWVSCIRLHRPPDRKTDLYEVVTRDDCQVIAEIRWYGPWRKYALFPRAGTVFEETCLNEIAKWLTQLRKERKHG
jgi:hypothetical protein